MKKLLSIIIMLTMLTTGYTFALADGEIYIDTPITDIFGENYSVSKFMSTSTNRALLSVCLCLDLGAAADFKFDAGECLAQNNSYVGKSDTIVVLTMYDSDYIYSIMYVPLVKKGAYIKTARESLSDSLIEMAVDKTCELYYKNDKSDILEVTKIFKDALNK